MKTFGDIIKDERKKRGLFLRHVAAATDIDQAIISKFEKGDRKPSKDQVMRIASFLQLDIEELMIAWLSDKVAYELQNEELAPKVLKVAESKINYIKKELLTQ